MVQITTLLGYLSSATWPSMSIKHYNGFINHPVIISYHLIFSILSFKPTGSLNIVNYGRFTKSRHKRATSSQAIEVVYSSGVIQCTSYCLRMATCQGFSAVRVTSSHVKCEFINDGSPLLTSAEAYNFYQVMYIKR